MLNRQEEASRAELQLEGGETQGHVESLDPRSQGWSRGGDCWEDLGPGREVLLGRDWSSLPSDPCAALPSLCSELQRG